MPAVKSADELPRDVPNKLSPCPADERVCAWYDVPDLFAPVAKRATDRESTSDDGVKYQKCGGGRRVIRKKIGGA